MQETFGEIPLKFLNYFEPKNVFISDRFYEPGHYPKLPKNHFMLARMVKKIIDIFGEIKIIYNANSVVLGLPITANDLIPEKDPSKINIFNELFLNSGYYVFTRHHDVVDKIESNIIYDKISLMYSTIANQSWLNTNINLYKNNHIYVTLTSGIFGRSGIPLPNFLNQDNEDFKSFAQPTDNHLEITASFKIYFDYFGLPDTDKIKIIDNHNNIKNDEFFRLMTTESEVYCFGESFLKKISRSQDNNNNNYNTSKSIYNLYGLDIDEFPVFVNKETEHMFFLNNKLYLEDDLFQPTSRYIIQKCNNKTFNGSENKTLNYFDFDKDNVRSFETALEKYILLIDNKASIIFEELYKQISGESPLEKTISFLNLVDKHVTRGQVDLFNLAYNDFAFNNNMKYDLLDFNLLKKLYSKLYEEDAKFLILKNTSTLSKRFETLSYDPYCVIFSNILRNDTIIFMDDRPLTKISRRIKDFINGLDNEPKNVSLIISQKPILLNVLAKMLRKNGIIVINVKDIPVQNQSKIKKARIVERSKANFDPNDLYIRRYSDGQYKIHSKKIKVDTFKEEKEFVKSVLNKFGKDLKVISAGDYKSLKEKPVLFDSFIEENKKEIIIKIKEMNYNDKYGKYFEHWVTNAFYEFNFFWLPLRIQEFFRDDINKISPEILILRDLAFKYNDEGILNIEETVNHLDSIRNINNRKIPSNLFDLSSDELKSLKSDFKEFNSYDDKNELYRTLNRVIYQEILSFIIKNKDKLLIGSKIDLNSDIISIGRVYFKQHFVIHSSNSIKIRNGLISEEDFERLLITLDNDKSLMKEFEITLNLIKKMFSNNIARLQYYKEL